MKMHINMSAVTMGPADSLPPLRDDRVAGVEVDDADFKARVVVELPHDGHLDVLALTYGFFNLREHL